MKRRPPKPRRRISMRGGSTVTEIFVSATLLLAMIGIVVPFAIRTGRLRQETRQHLVAMDELSNQLEYLTSLDREPRLEALKALQPSKMAIGSLPGATLTAETVTDQAGERIMLFLQWERSIDAPPLRMVGWVNPMPKSEATEEAVKS